MEMMNLITKVNIKTLIWYMCIFLGYYIFITVLQVFFMRNNLI